MATQIHRHNVLEAEIRLHVGPEEGDDKPARCTVDVDANIVAGADAVRLELGIQSSHILERT